MNKLVRDSVPGAIREKGETPATRALDDGEFARCLEEKLREEAEALEALARFQGWSWEDARRAKEEKSPKNGAFQGRVFPEKVIEDCLLYTSPSPRD